MVDQSKSAIVTGAGGVIGKACCRQLLADGYRVLAVDIDKEAGAALLDELGGDDNLVFESADVTDEADVKGYVRRALDLGRGINGFFNNAGVEGTVAPIVTMPVEIFDKVVAVNLPRSVSRSQACNGGNGRHWRRKHREHRVGSRDRRSDGSRPLRGDEARCRRAYQGRRVGGSGDRHTGATRCAPGPSRVG